MRDKFYVTTPIYYPNDIPHIGHTYTTLAGDVLARWNKLLKKDVFFLTGTDEHGKKIEEVAKKNKKTPLEFTNSLVLEFKDAWKKMNIDYDRFIRTTDKDHVKVVKEVLQKVYDKGDIYLGKYEGLYCIGCEAYFTEKDVENNSCPIHKKPIQRMSEESYFFRLSKYKDKLLELYEKNPEFILPKWRKKEVVNRLKEGLLDLSISRTSFDWGIKMPFDEKHITYVWFDALINYYTAVRKNEKFWPADVHLVAKDISWFHYVIWPAMLMSAGLKIPKSVFAHGFWTFDKEKISKSRGKTINVDELIKIVGVDSARYFLMREIPFGHDGDFSKKALVRRHNDELADKLGNLIQRVSGLIERYGVEKNENTLMKKFSVKKIEKLFESYEFDKVLNEIFGLVDNCNEYVQKKKPWETKDKKVLYELADSIKAIAVLLSPFMPETCEKISNQFNFSLELEEIKRPIRGSVKKSEILFEKVR